MTSSTKWVDAPSDVRTLSNVTRELHNERFNLRLTTAELTMLEALAVAMGVSASDVIRVSIHEKYRERFGEKPPKKKKTTP